MNIGKIISNMSDPWPYATIQLVLIGNVCIHRIKHYAYIIMQDI